MQWLTDLLASTVLGFLAGIGTGGGSLLLLWLTAIRGIAPEEARTVNLLFFLPSALISTLLRKNDTKPVYKDIFPAVAAGCAAAIAASLLRQHLETALLKKLFGCLLICAGIREVSYREK